jgi:hypothetical protein
MIFFWYEESSSAFRWAFISYDAVAGRGDCGIKYLDRGKYCMRLADYAHDDRTLLHSF